MGTVSPCCRDGSFGSQEAEPEKIAPHVYLLEQAPAKRRRAAKPGRREGLAVHFLGADEVVLYDKGDAPSRRLEGRRCDPGAPVARDKMAEAEMEAVLNSTADKDGDEVAGEPDAGDGGRRASPRRPPGFIKRADFLRLAAGKGEEEQPEVPDGASQSTEVENIIFSSTCGDVFGHSAELSAEGHSSSGSKGSAESVVPAWATGDTRHKGDAEEVAGAGLQ